MYPFICQSDSISPSRLNFPYQEVLPSFLSLTLPHSSFFFFFLALITKIPTICFLVQYVSLVRLQVPQRWEEPQLSDLPLISSLEHSAYHSINIEWVNIECLNIPLILYGLRHLIYGCTSVFPHIIFLEIYNLQSPFTVFVVSVKKVEQMSLSLTYNWKKK